MKEELMKKILEILNGTEFLLKGQVPEVLEQYLKMLLVNNIIYASISLITTILFLIIVIIIIRTHIRVSREDKYNSFYDDEGAMVLTYTLLVGSMIITSIIFFDKITSVINIYIAPKAYLIEYFR